MMMLGLVFGVSAVIYILDIPGNTTLKNQITPTIAVPTNALILPTEGISAIPTPLTRVVVPTTAIPTISSLKHLSATINYSVRFIPETITVNLTLDGLTVSDLQLIQNTDNRQSAAYQDAFLSEIKPTVVGKNIKDINVSAVAGASYTTDAFMQAIDKIRSNI